MDFSAFSVASLSTRGAKLAQMDRIFGEVILPGDDAYDAARAIHSPGFDRRPAMVVRTADAVDVILAVEFARTHELPIAVRSGGHSVAGHSSVDGEVVVDLARMNAVAVDRQRSAAWVQPGATTADPVAAVEPHGLSRSTGDTATVEIGGLTLGGGIGWMVRKYGLTIDSLLSVEMVTADGRLVIASNDENPDLFWALRGGGGNFGIATGFEFQLHPVDMVLGGVLILPATRTLLEGYLSSALSAPDELTTISMLAHLPPLPFIPADCHGELAIVVFVCYAGDPDAGQVAVAPLRALAEPVADLIGPMPYSALYQFTAVGAEPHDSTIRSGFMDDLPTDLIDLLLDYARENPAPFGMIQLRALGGAFSRVSNEATAFAHRDKRVFLAVINMGRGQEIDRWVLDLWRKVEGYASGVYVDFLADEGEARVRSAYGEANWERLRRIKREYDPKNVFRLNQNIKPAL